MWFPSKLFSSFTSSKITSTERNNMQVVFAMWTERQAYCAAHPSAGEDFYIASPGDDDETSMDKHEDELP
jgi:hypothetical protein